MNIQLSLKKKWFEMTKSGIKTEDYREITPYWAKRLIVGLCDSEDSEDLDYLCNELKNGRWFQNSFNDYLCRFKDFNQNTMTLGYPKSGDIERIIKFEHAGIEIREGNPEWGAELGNFTLSLNTEIE